MTLSLDSRQSAAQQMTSIDIGSTPIVFRASQRDINLIMAIVTKAAQMAAKPAPPEPRPAVKSTKSAGRVTSSKAKTAGFAMEQPRLVMSREKVRILYMQWPVTELHQLKAELDGFRLVLIGEAHEQPMLHLRTKPFRVNVQDWSADVSLLHYNNVFPYLPSRCMHPPRSLLESTIGTLRILIGNQLSNPGLCQLMYVCSHCSGHGSNTPQVTTTQTGGLVANITSHERLEVDISTTFVETALAAVATWNQQNLRPTKLTRGGVAPYRIRNQTGVDLELWSSHNGKQVDVTALNNNQETDWRFDDWKSLREVRCSCTLFYYLPYPCSTCRPPDTTPLASSSKASHGNK